MDDRGASKQKVDAWFSSIGNRVDKLSLESTNCVSEAMVAEGINGGGGGESSGAKKKKNRKRHKATNSKNWPRKVVTWKLQEVALDF